MKVVSYYGRCQPEEHFKFWEINAGIMIPQTIHDDECICSQHIPIQSEVYSPIENNFDVAYCQMYAVPTVRPAKYVYTFLSDYYPEKVHNWIKQVKPNIMYVLNGTQYITQLEKVAKEYGCKIIFRPWSVQIPQISDNIERNIHAFSSGCINHNYPFRNLAYDYLFNLKKRNTELSIELSGSVNFGNYRLSNEQYRDTLSQSRYYVTGLIFDELVPPKIFEAASYGCCIITSSKNTYWLEKAGFINDETCILVNNVNEIESIIKSDKYKQIGKNARQMIINNHSVQSRALQIKQDIMDLYDNK